MNDNNIFYTIGAHIKLILEYDHNYCRYITQIYVDDEKFLQCKYLLLNLDDSNIDDFKDVESIDDAFKLYSRKHEGHSNKIIIDEKTEFIGHCSNLQAWHENDYNLNILHSSLSIPLLKKLIDVGDQKAIKALKEEVAVRCASGNENTIIYFINENYMDYFTSEELETLFEVTPIDNQQLLRRINRLINIKHIWEKSQQRGIEHYEVGYQ